MIKTIIFMYVCIQLFMYGICGLRFETVVERERELNRSIERERRREKERGVEASEKN